MDRSPQRATGLPGRQLVAEPCWWCGWVLPLHLPYLQMSVCGAPVQPSPAQPWLGHSALLGRLTTFTQCSSPLLGIRKYLSQSRGSTDRWGGPVPGGALRGRNRGRRARQWEVMGSQELQASPKPPAASGHEPPSCSDLDSKALRESHRPCPQQLANSSGSMAGTGNRPAGCGPQRLLLSPASG